MQIDEISQESGFPKATTYRLVRILINNGFMEKDPDNRGYRLGIRLLQMGHIVRHQRRLPDIAQPFMEELRNICHESVSLDVREGNEVLILRGVEGTHPMRMKHREGSTMPFHTGSPSKVLLSHLPLEEQDKIIQRGLDRYTENTITDPIELKKELIEIREKGYAFSDQELQLGAKSVAAPIRDYSGEVIACIGIDGPIHRFDEEKIEYLIPLVMEYAEKISLEMGYSGRLAGGAAVHSTKNSG